MCNNKKFSKAASKRASKAPGVDNFTQISSYSFPATLGYAWCHDVTSTHSTSACSLYFQSQCDYRRAQIAMQKWSDINGLYLLRWPQADCWRSPMAVHAWIYACVVVSRGRTVGGGNVRNHIIIHMYMCIIVFPKLFKLDYPLLYYFCHPPGVEPEYWRLHVARSGQADGNRGFHAEANLHAHDRQYEPVSGNVT